jgi:uncharacterized membrane protein
MREPTTGTLETALGRLVTAGTYLAIAMVAVGVAVMVGTARSPLGADAAPLDIGTLPGLIAAGRPEGFLWLGLLAAVATPVGRVVGAVVGFAIRRESRLVAVGVAILAVIASAVLLALLAA